MPRKVLVTGGLGFIGSNIVDELVKQGYDVSVVDNKNSEQEIISRNLGARYFAPYDICKKDSLKRCFNFFRPDYVIHCAALARIQPSFDHPLEYLKVNVLGTVNLLQLSLEYGVKKFVYSASSSAYGIKTKMPIGERMKTDCRSPYALTKFQGEQWVELYAKAYSLFSCSLRYFNVYGDRQPTEGQYATVIGIFLRQWKEGRDSPFTIYGDGKQSRDFTHVDDVARANILAMESEKVCKGEVINIGCGRTWSILEVAKLIDENHPIQFLPSRCGEAKITMANTSLARELLGWKAKIYFPDGIKLLKKQ